jgi:AAA domain-containing protein
MTDSQKKDKGAPAPRVRKRRRNRSRGARFVSNDLIMQPLSGVRSARLRWLRPDIIPRNKVSLLVGDPGLGKSFVSLDMALRIAGGLPWPEGGRAPKGPVVILAGEDAADDTIKPRLQAMGATRDQLDRIIVLEGRVVGNEGTRSRLFDLSRDLHNLQQAIKRLRPVLLIIDPLQSYLGQVDSFKDAEVRTVLTPLAKVAARQKITIVCLMHLSKSGSKALYRVGGSIAFTGVARTVHMVLSDPEGPTRRFLVELKRNLGPKRAPLAFTIQPKGRSAIVVWEKTAPSEADVRRALSGKDSARDNAVEWLDDLLTAAGGTMMVKRLQDEAAKAGMNWRVVEEAKQVLKVEAERVGGIGKQGYWVWKRGVGSSTLPPMSRHTGLKKIAALTALGTTNTPSKAAKTAKSLKTAKSVKTAKTLTTTTTTTMTPSRLTSIEAPRPIARRGRLTASGPNGDPATPPGNNVSRTDFLKTVRRAFDDHTRILGDPTDAKGTLGLTMMTMYLSRLYPRLTEGRVRQALSECRIAPYHVAGQQHYRRADIEAALRIH